MARILLSFLVFLTLFTSCGRVKRDLSITAYTPGSDSHNAALALKEVLEDEGWKITVVSQPHVDGLDAVRSGEVDLAITSNDISMDSRGIRTIIPLYHEVLAVLAKKDSPLRRHKSFAESREYLTNNKIKVLFSYKGSYAHLLSQRLLTTQGINPDQYETYNFPESVKEYSDGLEVVDELSPDVIYIVGTEDSRLVHELLKKGYKLSDSNDGLENIEASSTMSFANKMARCFPAVVPTYAFSIYQEHPILTLGIYTSLVASKNLNEATAYELSKEIVNAFPNLVTTNSSFVDLKENFDRKLLNYKLHSGSRSYFDRDKPSFFERYAEMSGVIFSMFVVFITFLVSMNRVVKQRKKDRIDVFYVDAEAARHTDDPTQGIKDLAALQEKAFEHLIGERLSADASFIVFLQLVQEIREELKLKLLKEKKVI